MFWAYSRSLAVEVPFHFPLRRTTGTGNGGSSTVQLTLCPLVDVVQASVLTPMPLAPGGHLEAALVGCT